jgi:glycine/D-amino acid oxidase-like deaminating enzyme
MLNYADKSSEFGVWANTAPPALSLPNLAADTDCDILIIGAGYTGLSTALHLAEQSIPCMVIEAQQPGWGASGRNTGWLEPNWWMKQPKDLTALFGEELGNRLTRWVARGPELLRGWIQRYQLEIEFSQNGLLLTTDQKSKALEWVAEARDWQALGVNNRYLNAEEISGYVPTDRYCGGLLLSDGATLNPLALSRELARACVESGVSLYASSPAASIARKGAHWEVATPQGVITARRLVLATDAYTRDLWPGLRSAFATWELALIASAPYAAMQELLPRGTPIGDMALSNILTLRSTHTNCLVTSTFAPLRPGLSAQATATPFMRKFRRVFPHLPPPQWLQVHRGVIGLSQDMMPRLCRIGPGAWTAYGYSGTGINLAMLLGGELAKLAATDEPRETLFPVSELKPMSAHRLISAGMKYLHAPLSRHLISRFA